VSPRKIESREQKEPTIKKETEKPKKDRKPNNKSNGNGKIKSQNRFEGL